MLVIKRARHKLSSTLADELKLLSLYLLIECPIDGPRKTPGTILNYLLVLLGITIARKPTFNAILVHGHPHLSKGVSSIICNNLHTIMVVDSATNVAVCLELEDINTLSSNIIYLVKNSAPQISINCPAMRVMRSSIEEAVDHIRAIGIKDIMIIHRGGVAEVEEKSKQLSRMHVLMACGKGT